MVCDEEAKCKPITGAFTFYGTDLIIARHIARIPAMEAEIEALQANLK